MKAKPLVWLRGEVKTPPFGEQARLEAGYLLRKLQEGELVGLPHSRPMPSIDKRCHELRIGDSDQSWRIIYAIEPDAIVILEVFSKKSQQTPRKVVDACARRLELYRSL